MGVRRVGLPVDRMADETLLMGLGSANPEIAIAFVRAGVASTRRRRPSGRVVAVVSAAAAVIAVGTVSVAGSPTWVTVSIRQGAVTGLVTCQLLGRHGVVRTIGTFDLVNGSGSWGAPDPSGAAGLTGAVLVGPDGAVVARATFEST